MNFSLIACSFSSFQFKNSPTPNSHYTMKNFTKSNQIYRLHCSLYSVLMHFLLHFLTSGKVNKVGTCQPSIWGKNWNWDFSDDNHSFQSFIHLYPLFLITLVFSANPHTPFILLDSYRYKILLISFLINTFLFCAFAFMSVFFVIWDASQYCLKQDWRHRYNEFKSVFYRRIHWPHCTSYMLQYGKNHEMWGLNSRKKLNKIFLQ